MVKMVDHPEQVKLILITTTGITGDTVASEAAGTVKLTTNTTFEVDEHNGKCLIVTAGTLSGNVYKITDTETDGTLTLESDPGAGIVGDTVNVYFNGSYYPLNETVSVIDAKTTKFLVIPIPNRNHGDIVQFSEFFKIEIEADSEANMDIAIKRLKSAWSGRSGGYTWATAGYPFWVGNIIINDKPVDSNEFYGELEVEARWSIT